MSDSGFRVHDLCEIQGFDRGLGVEGTECRVYDWYEIKGFDRGFMTKVSGFAVEFRGLAGFALESREQTKAAAPLRNPGGGFRVDNLEIDEEL